MSAPPYRPPGQYDETGDVERRLQEEYRSRRATELRASNDERRTQEGEDIQKKLTKGDDDAEDFGSPALIITPIHNCLPATTRTKASNGINESESGIAPEADHPPPLRRAATR